MYSYTRKWDDWVFNQNTINKFWPDCAAVSIAQIFWLNYDIWVEEKTLALLIEMAIRDEALTSRGAIFSVLYNYITLFVTKHFWETVIVYKNYIGTTKLKKMLDQWYNFWIWLKNWNNKYLEAVSKWEITLEDVDLIFEEGWWFAHNHVLWTKNWEYWIFEIYRWKFIKCDLSVLEYWVVKWLWRSTARTFVFSDKLLEKALFDYKAEKNIEDVQLLPIEEQEAISKASKLRVFKTLRKDTL